jgi:hypothetical protein
VNRREDLGWGVIVIAGITYEVWAVRTGRDPHTLSGTTRRWMRTSHPAGRAIFAGGWLGFATWYTIHIWKGSYGETDGV